MILTGVSAHGVELAQMLATLLQRHGHIDNPPEDLDALLEMGRKALEEPLPAYCVAQEGGSTTELYLHVWDSKEQAEQDRIDCANDGAYRTSDVFEVPGTIAIQPGFFDVMEAAVQSVLTLDCVDLPERNEDEDHANGQDRYLVAEGWVHMFADVGQRTVRFAYDRQSRKIVRMQVLFGFGGWKTATVGQSADVADSLNTAANGDALENPEDYGLTEADELPGWYSGGGSIGFIEDPTATTEPLATAGSTADYTVAVEVQVTADSHEDAARFALADLQDKDIQEWVMTVTNSLGSKDVTVPGNLKESA